MNATNPENSSYDVGEIAPPDFCPVCRIAGTMQQVSQAFIRYHEGWSYNEVLQVNYRCPKRNCGAIFITEYETDRSFGGRSYKAVRYFPIYPQKPSFPAEINTISPNFVSIYSQAIQAKNAGLGDVYGMGLRKSLEFLVKDYCISKVPDKEVEIKSEFLGNVIKNRVSDANVKACAQRAAWLGNDESHYERRWNDHDAEDLRRLITLTVNWIHNDILTEKYLKEMQ